MHGECSQGDVRRGGLCPGLSCLAPSGLGSFVRTAMISPTITRGVLRADRPPSAGHQLAASPPFRTDTFGRWSLPKEQALILERCRLGQVANRSKQFGSLGVGPTGELLGCAPGFGQLAKFVTLHRGHCRERRDRFGIHDVDDRQFAGRVTDDVPKRRLRSVELCGRSPRHPHLDGSLRTFRRFVPECQLAVVGIPYPEESRPIEARCTPAQKCASCLPTTRAGRSVREASRTQPPPARCFPSTRQSVHHAKEYIDQRKRHANAPRLHLRLFNVEGPLCRMH